MNSKKIQRKPMLSDINKLVKSKGEKASKPA
jgi:hypothetical protein